MIESLRLLQLICYQVAACSTLLIVCCITGCKPTVQGPKTFPVTGLVTHEGSPVAGATVLFHPKKKGEGVKTASGETDADGKFELQSNVKGGTYQLGAPAAEYYVTIEKLDRSQVHETMSPPKSLLPNQYRSPKNSGLTATVSAERDNTFNFDL